MDRVAYQENSWLPAYDIVIGDMVSFKEPVFSGYYKNAKYLGERINLVRVIKESYGKDKQQHTFTLEVVSSNGVQPLSSGQLTKRKGRNLYGNASRLLWDDESNRNTIAAEKHSRGEKARQQKTKRLSFENNNPFVRASRLENGESLHPICSPGLPKSQHRAVTSSRTKGNPNKQHQQDSVKRNIQKAAQLFKHFHGFDPKAIDHVKLDAKIPRTLIKIGVLREILYHSDKDNPGKAKRYLHDFKKPYPILCADVSGKRLFIIGGKFRIKSEGIIN